MAVLACIAPFGFSFDPVRFLAAYRAVGCSTAQFYRNEQKPPTVAQALAAAEKVGMRFDSIHGVFGFHLDPSSSDARHRQRCLEIYEAEGKLASDLGGPMVVVHPAAWNPGMRMMSREEVEKVSEPRWPLLDDFMRRLAEVGQRLGVTYLIENQPMNCPLGHDTVRLSKAVLAVNSPFIRMCLDTGHANMTGDVVATTRKALPAIRYFHVHDNDSKIDDHRMPFDGGIKWADLAKVFVEAGDAIPRMLEVFYDEARVEEMGRNGLAQKLKDSCAVSRGKLTGG